MAKIGQLHTKRFLRMPSLKIMVTIEAQGLNHGSQFRAALSNRQTAIKTLYDSHTAEDERNRDSYCPHLSL